ncbi:MAG TPA: hypothetical protein IAB59_06295 [Candidatus Onthousia faecipullorum]|uniref:Transposase n=1 Tax=Candidatus Onthousia faecipullorum TaxID=2840887 RepID=A0A9D1KCD6_9FIRM|nr:hypothetical protein [Candidatus Onthousia faecipullorum]
MNKVPRFISLMSDTTAKALIKDDHYRWFYEEVIKFKTGVDLKGYQLMDPELNTGNRGKDYRLDLIFISKTKLFNLELNQFVYPHTFIKSLKYALRLAGNGYIKGQQYYQRYVTQLNLNYKIMSDKVKRRYQGDYKLEDCKCKDKLKDIRVVATNLLDYKGIVYNGTNKYETFLSMLTAESYEEMERIVGDLKEGKIIMEKLKELGLDDEFGAIYDEEIVHKMEINSARSDGRKEGRKEGATNEKKSIAKNLLKMNLSVKDIMKATGLSKKQITTLM